MGRFVRRRGLLRNHDPARWRRGVAHRSAPWVVVLPLALAGGGPGPAPAASREGSALVVVVRPGPPTWCAGANGAPSGLDHDLLERFAREQKLPLVVVLADSATRLISKVSRGEGHIGGGGLFQ